MNNHADVDAGNLDVGNLDAGDVGGGDAGAGDVDAGDVDAGDFTTWLNLARRPLGDDADVPCGACTACCTSSFFIHIGPDETEARGAIPDELLFAAPGLPHGHVVMGYDEQGCCPMFVDGGCSIYDVRPQTCRDYDCRIFAATGIDLDDDDKALIVAQTRRWKFKTTTEAERQQHSALRACAAYLQANARRLPAGSVPRDPTQLALLTIDIHEIFLDGESKCGDPEIDVVADALDAWTANIRATSALDATDQ